MNKIKQIIYVVHVILLTCGCAHDQLNVEDFTEAIKNGKQANEGYVRSLKLTKAWLDHADPESGLIPTVLNNERKDYWEVENSAADNYPFMVLTSYLLDKDLYNG